MTLIRDINHILKYGKKTSSYKFATLLAIFDYIIEHPSERPVNNFHFVPIVYLAKQFISYYYPLSYYNIYQGSFAEDKTLAVFNHIEKFKSEIKEEPNRSTKMFTNIETSNEEGIFWINELYDYPEPLPESLQELLWRIRKRILEQPLKYLHNVKGEVIRFFGLINNNIPFNEAYETHLNEAIKQKNPGSMQWEEIMKSDLSNLIIDDLVYKEMARYCFWARDVILKAWYEYSIDGELNKKMSKSISINFYNLLGYAYLGDYPRDTNLIKKYREFYGEIHLNECFFSDKGLQNNDYDLDHLLPWSHYRVNRFWNLYPCDPIINRKKSNFLPNWTEELEKRIKNHLRACLNHKNHPLILKDLIYFYNIIHKNQSIKIENLENDKIEMEVLLTLKRDWTHLYQSIPGILFEYHEQLLKN